MNVSPITAVVAALQAEVVALMDSDLTVLGEIVSAAPAAESAPDPSASSGPHPVPSSVAQAVVTALAAAAGRQGSLAPLMADLAQAQASPALPAPVRAAIVQVLALETPLAGPLTAQVVARAVAQSGLFLEAHLATADGQAVAPDLKGALLTLQRVLTPPRGDKAPPPEAPPLAQQAPVRSAIAQPPAAPPSASAGGAPAPQQATSPQTSSPQTSSPQTSSPQASSPQPSAPEAIAPQPSTIQASAPQAPASRAELAAPATPDLKTALAAVRDALSTPTGEPPALPAPLRAAISQLLAPPAPGLTSPAVQASARAPAELGPLLAAWLADGQDETAAPEVKAALAALQQALPAPADETPAPPPRSTPPPPPSRDAAMTGQAAARSSLPEHADAQTITQVLARGVDQALARQTLHQLASLPEGPGQTWMFELPLATPQGTAIAQFEIDHDGGAAGGAQGQPGWRVRFSIDIEPLGPVHVQLAAGAERAAVTVWAERPDGFLRLRSLGDELARALPADVRFQSGAPRPPASTPGHFLDQSS